MRRHLGRRECVIKVGRGGRQVESSLHATLQGACIENELDMLCRSRSGQLRKDGQATETGDLQQIFQWSVGWLLKLQCRVHPVCVETQLHVIVADSTGTVC